MVGLLHMPPEAPAPASAAANEPTRLWAMAAALLAYIGAGLVALQLAIPPGFAAPLYPPAGIALAAVLVFGVRMVPAVALGAFAVNLTLSAQRGNLDLAALGLPGVIAFGAAAQAWLGAALVKRFARQPQAIAEPRDIAVLLGLGALAACMVSCTVATAALGLTATVPPEALVVTWFTWWAGDALGALIAAPIVLTLIGRPREDWAARRLTVGLTLALVTLVMALGIAQVARWDDERVRSAFARDATNATSVLATHLQEPLLALEALRGVFIASEDVNRDEMRRASAAWVASGSLAAVGWYERVERAAVPTFEARARAEGLSQYHVFDRGDAQAPGDEVIAMRFIQPELVNAAALGLNLLSIPAARAAAEATARLDRPQASAAFALTQIPASEDRTGVVIYRAVYNGEPSEAQRRARLRGVLFVTLRPGLVMATIARDLPPYLKLCLVDTTLGAAPKRLAGPPDCEAAGSAALAHARTIRL